MGWMDKLKSFFGTSSVKHKPRLDGTQSATSQEQLDDLWQQVYSAREKFYIDHIGEIPSDILKIGHMFGVWPGGGLFVIAANKIETGCWAYSTFGFTNIDMPTSTKVSKVSVETDDLGRTIQTAGRLEAKNRTIAPSGAAGYGYELLVLARENEQWPLWILQWAANAEILNDAGILERVNKYGGLTIDGVRSGENKSVNLLIAKAREPLPTATALPNGKMELLIATVITEAEMRWSIEHGCEALLDLLIKSGAGQFSLLDRVSTVQHEHPQGAVGK